MSGNRSDYDRENISVTTTEWDELGDLSLQVIFPIYPNKVSHSQVKRPKTKCNNE